jgi:UDP-N-acetylmuramoyl-tripeptide--D-alanyl-D-alanine ligase
MNPLTLSLVSEWVGGRLDQASAAKTQVTGVSTDTREIVNGNLFIALKGEKFNGHDFLGDLAQKGATAAMVEQSEMEGRKSSVPLVIVENALSGLQALAKKYRAGLNLKTVAVAGSNGKTSTKEMIAAVLGTQFMVLKNKGNLNNHIGVPVSLLKLDSSHQVGVFEVGTNHPGELVPLIEMVNPIAGAITTIGEEHLEFFHDLAGVAKEEGTLAEALPKEGLVVLNADNDLCKAIASRSQAKVQFFGLSKDANYRADNIEMSISGTRFDLVTPSGRVAVQMQLLGRHLVTNALAAAAVGEFFGLKLNSIRDGLQGLAPYKMRMERMTTRTGVVVINDSYNSNPSSMRAALETLRDIKVSGKRIAVLGEMRELGEASKVSHQEIGEYAASCKVDVLAVVGNEASGFIEGANRARSVPQIERLENVEQAQKFLKEKTQANDVVLLKASRGVALEGALEGLI